MRNAVGPGILTAARAWLFAVVLGTLAPVRAADKTGDEDRYVQLYEHIFARQEPGAAKMPVHERLWLADVAVRLAQRTGHTTYRDKACSLFTSALPEVAHKPTDFHALRGIALVILPLRQAGLITPEQERMLRAMAGNVWKDFLAAPEGSSAGDADNNIRLAQALSSAALATYFADDRTVDAQPIRQRLEHYWARIKATGDLDEDASNYTGLGMVHCLELAQMLGHTEDLRAPGFRRMFERLRDTVSTTGLVPEFGDGFFHLDRGAFDFLFLCEYAAKLYDDPTYLTVAQRLYDPAAFGKEMPDEWGRAVSLLELKVSTRQPEPLPAASVVNYRANRTSGHPVADKLILRTGNEPGSAMVFMDLYAAGSHAHPSKGPAVAYYEVDGVPLFHNLGRHRTRSAITGNSFWALEEARTFPGIWKADTWFTMCIPTELLLHDATGAVVVGDHVTLRNFDNRGTRELCFDNLRLEGPAGVKLLDGFESAQTWHRSLTSAPNIKIVTTPDHTQGAAAQSLNWGVLSAGAYTRMLADARNFTFQPEEFDALKVDVKYTGIRPYLHLRDLCQQIDLGDQALPYDVGSARVAQRGRDAYGEVVFSRYIAADAQLTRRLVLTAEGCLVIHDRWVAGKARPQWTAGQLWQFYALKDRGADWFCGDDDGSFSVPDGHGGTKSVTRRMLVKFGAGPGTETFVEENVQPCLAPNLKNRPQDRFFTIGSKRTVASGQESSFTLVVVPHDPSCAAARIAAAVRVTDRPDGVEAVLVPPATAATIHVVLFRDGRWDVARTP